MYSMYGPTLKKQITIIFSSFIVGCLNSVKFCSFLSYLINIVQVKCRQIHSVMYRFEWLLQAIICFGFLVNSLATHNGDVISFNKILERYFAGDDSVTESDWLEALPSDTEIREMKELIRKLFKCDSFDEFNGTNFLDSYPALRNQLQITVLKKEYCVVHERFPSTQSANQRFRRFWGYVVVTSKRVAKRHYLHHSAPHFLTDGEVCAQSAAMFQSTKSRSLVVAGASRFAIDSRPTSECQSLNEMADAAHDNRTMFHAMCSAVWAASRRSPRRSSHSRHYRRQIATQWQGQARQHKRKNIYIQWHGMANDTCGDIAVYGSAGVNESNGVYRGVDVAVNKIITGVNYVTGRRLAETPATAQCILKATTNIFGRLINGVPAESVCTVPILNPTVCGQFVHIEQKNWIMADWNMWTNVLRSEFPTERS